MSELTDDDLLARCLEAQHTAAEAFTELYDRHAGAVLAFLKALHRGDEDAASDILQETFFRFYLSLSSFQRGRPLRPWLLTIARNASFDARKRARREVPEPPGGITSRAEPTGGPAEEAIRHETAALLRQALGDLPEEEMAVFLLKHDHGLTYEQVAEGLNCSVRTAKYRMKAALVLLGREARRLGVANA